MLNFQKEKTDKLAFQVHRDSSSDFSTQTCDSDSTDIIDRTNSSLPVPNMSRAASPILKTTDEKLSLLLSKVSQIELGMTVLNRENANRVDEILKLSKKLGFQAKVETDKECPEYTSEDEDVDDGHERNRVQSPLMHSPSFREHNLRATGEDANNPFNESLLAKDIIRTIKGISGQDDMGIEDFIKSIERAKHRCRQSDSLLDFILAEKITGNAERAIRYLQINSYQDLYNALRQNLSQVGSASALRSKLEGCKQGLTETVQNFNLRFRQTVNELKYVVQSEHNEPMERKIAINIEEKECTKRYLLNVKREIGLQVKAQKPSNLNEAQNHAIEMEMWLNEAQPARTMPTNFGPPMRAQPSLPSRQFVLKSTNPTPFKPPQFNQSQSTRTPPGNCHKFGKQGHFISQCPNNTRQNFPQGTYQKRPPQAVRRITDGTALFRTNGNEPRRNQ